MGSTPVINAAPSGMVCSVSGTAPAAWSRTGSRIWPRPSPWNRLRSGHGWSPSISTRCLRSTNPSRPVRWPSSCFVSGCGIRTTWSKSLRSFHKVLAPGLVLALVLDLPKKVMSLKSDELKAWGLTSELAWSAAEENSKREQYEVIPQTRPDGTQIFFLTGDNLYVTSNALWLDERIELESENGALIGVPTRHVLVVLPIRDINVVKAVSGMHAANRRIFEEGPGSISADLYWWRKRTFTLFPIDASTQRMQARPPDEFVDMLNRLAPGAKS